jgi:hypothetical protein
MHLQHNLTTWQRYGICCLRLHASTPAPADPAGASEHHRGRAVNASQEEQQPTPDSLS